MVGGRLFVGLFVCLNGLRAGKGCNPLLWRLPPGGQFQAVPSSVDTQSPGIVKLEALVQNMIMQDGFLGAYSPLSLNFQSLVPRR